MKKKGRSGTAGEGIAGATASRHVAADKLDGRGCGLVGMGGGGEWNDGGRRESENGSGLWPRPSWVAAEHVMTASFLLLLNFIFTAC